MGLVANILGRPRVLVVSFASADTWSLQFDGEPESVPDLAAVQARAGKAPLLVAVCGYGVIAKDAASDATAKVTAPGSGFLWQRDAGQVVFVREAQVESFAALKPLAIVCGASAADAGRIAAHHYDEHTRLRDLLRPTPESSTLASLLARRIQMPVLCVLLALLAANAFVGARVLDRWQAAQAERTALEKRLGQADNTSRNRAQTLAEWGRIPPHGFAWLCDRAASAVPRDVTLASLTIQPLLKAIEEGRQPRFSENEMVVTGHTRRSESVSEYAAALGTLGLAGQVRLSSVEYDREKGTYTFRINLEL